MKNIVLLIVCFITYNMATAQFTIGVQAGGNVSNPRIKFGSTKIDTKLRGGFQFGFIGDVALGGRLAFKPGLQFLRKSAKYETDNPFRMGNSKYKETVNINYLALPLNVVYKLPLGKGKIFFGLGAEVCYAISGKDILSETSGGVITTTDYAIDFGTNKDDDDLRPFDLGANALIGYEFNSKFGLQLQYTFGFANLYLQDDAKWRNRSLGLSLFYNFGRL